MPHIAAVLFRSCMAQMFRRSLVADRTHDVRPYSSKSNVEHFNSLDEQARLMYIVDYFNAKE